MVYDYPFGWISRFLGNSKSTIQRQILRLSKSVIPLRLEENQVYELDEMHTYVGAKIDKNVFYITYAINRSTKKVVDFVVGRRNMITIKKVMDEIKALNPNTIITDKLNLYPNLIYPFKHVTRPYFNNHIERGNLS